MYCLKRKSTSLGSSNLQTTVETSASCEEIRGFRLMGKGFDVDGYLLEKPGTVVTAQLAEKCLADCRCNGFNSKGELKTKVPTTLSSSAGTCLYKKRNEDECPAVLFDEQNHSGNSQAIAKPGVYNFCRGELNYTIRSVKVKPGYVVSLVKHCHNGPHGPRLVLKESAATLPPALDKQVSVVIVQLAGEEEPKGWTCISPTNTMAGHWVPVQRNANGDIQCLSGNAKNCVWSKSEEQCKLDIQAMQAKAKPLVCGESHKKFYGITGSDSKGHWCYDGDFKL